MLAERELRRMLRAPAYLSVTFSSNHGCRAADRGVSSTNPAAAFRLASERALADAHLMSLVSTPGQATIAVGMRMGSPPDGSSADLEQTRAGYHRLPYGRPWLADDRGRRYTVTFDGEGGNEVWRGVLRMSPAPPPGARWLDLVADETNRLIRLDLRQAAGTDARRRPRCARTWRPPRPSGCSRWKPKPSWPTP
ncbi:MAG: hypothetical protein ACRDPF_02325 [Streptosporangiaceae bacterium]